MADDGDDDDNDDDNLDVLSRNVLVCFFHCCDLRCAVCLALFVIFCF